MSRGEKLPLRHAREPDPGRNVSPALHLDALPAGTQSVAFSLVDRDAEYVHWMVVDVPPGDIRLAEGASRAEMPPGSRELYNSAQYQGYIGPDPRPKTTAHRLELLAYALDVPNLEVDEHAGIEEFKRAAEEHALAIGQNYWLHGNT
jgi:Raf kinase inhibitor-like YbhB/YbcL family protein